MRLLNHHIPLVRRSIREICSRPVEQGRCELVVCVASEKSLPIAANRVLESSHSYRSHVCVFDWAYPKVDFAQGLELVQREGAPKAFWGRLTLQSYSGNIHYIAMPATITATATNAAAVAAHRIRKPCFFWAWNFFGSASYLLGHREVLLHVI